MLLENQITEKIIGCAIKVHIVLGPGLLESAYQECLFYEIKKSGLLVEKEKTLPVIYEEVQLEVGYRIDLLIEKKVIVNKMNKRFDIVVYNRDGSVKLLVECKAPSVKIDQAVFDQTLIYNKSLNSQFMMITNGLIHFFFKIDYKTKKYKFIKEFPFS